MLFSVYLLDNNRHYSRREKSGVSVNYPPGERSMQDRCPNSAKRKESSSSERNDINESMRHNALHLLGDVIDNRLQDKDQVRSYKTRRWLLLIISCCDVPANINLGDDRAMDMNDHDIRNDDYKQWRDHSK